MRYDNVFYSFQLKDLPKFEQAIQIIGELASVPKELDRNFFLNQWQQNETYANGRMEVYHRPIVDQMLRREAEEAFRRKLPYLRKDRAVKKPDVTPKTGEWAFSQGHYAHQLNSRSAELQAMVDAIFEQHCHPVGDFIYPPKGYRSWHTNKFDSESWAIFFVHVDQAEKSFFRFIHPDSGEMITSWDQPFSINIFQIQANPLFWHCIASEEAVRWSQGFLIPDNWKTYI